MNHSWKGNPTFGLTCGATVNSLTFNFDFKDISLIVVSTSFPITCSPKAEIKCLILPVTIILKGFISVN